MPPSRGNASHYQKGRRHLVWGRQSRQRLSAGRLPAVLAATPRHLYESDGDGFLATALTRGPWSPEHQHAGPPTALLTRAIERVSGIEGGQTARLSFDILRPIPIGRMVVEARVVRGGRSVEQIEATLSDGAETLVRATAWRMATEANEAVAHVEPPPSRPDHGEPGAFAFWRDEVAYHRALDWRVVAGDVAEPGPATVWARLLVPLVAGEEPTPLERLLVMADAASGVSAALPWDRWLFVNVDVGIHLSRPPRGEWTAMAARTSIGPSGMGLCTSTLFDLDGAVGVSTQTLVVRRR